MGSCYSFTALNLLEIVSSQTRCSDSREWGSGQTQYINSVIKWIQQSAQKQDKKCGLHSSLFHSVYPVKRKKQPQRLWEIITSGHSGISHLAQLWWTSQTVLVSQFIQPSLPVLPVPKLILWTWGAAEAGDTWAISQAACPPSPSSTHPPLGVCLGFFRDFFLQKFCLEEWEQGEGRISNRKVSVSALWACQLRAKEEKWIILPLSCYPSLSPVSKRCSFSMDLKRSWFTPATAPAL